MTDYYFQICQHCNRISGDTIMSGREYIGIGDTGKRIWSWCDENHKCTKFGREENSTQLNYSKIIIRTDKRTNTRKKQYSIRLNREISRRIVPKLNCFTKKKQQKLFLEALRLSKGKFGKGNPRPKKIKNRLIKISEEIITLNGRNVKNRN